MNVSSYVKAISEFLDSMSSEHGNIEADIAIIKRIVEGWEVSSPEDRAKLQSSLQELADALSPIEIETKVALYPREITEYCVPVSLPEKNNADNG